MDNRILQKFLLAASLASLGVMGLTGCLLHRKRNTDLPGPVAAGDQPDKILYERAMNEIDRGRYDIGRLTLQTLLNTYPDSEFLAKAKLAIADSYYNEGGISGLTQAEAEYKDFITFFPTAPEAPEAQFRAGMAHYRLMGKPDRDRTEARLAEAEFKEFLLKFPNSKLLPRVKGRLREVQEVLGRSDYQIAEFYFLKQSNRAARSRFQEIADRYPDFSQADDALWYLGQTLERLKTPKEAANYYSQLITDYPLSARVDDAKERLTALHQPVPHPTRAMMARARADEARRGRQDILSKMSGVFSSSPDVSATRHGPVRIGRKPTEPEVARAGTPGTGGNSIAVETVGDSSLNSGKAVDAKPEGSDPAAKAPADSQGNSNTPADPEGAAKQTETKPSTTASTPSATTTSTKKKGRFHILKKITPF